MAMQLSFLHILCFCAALSTSYALLGMGRKQSVAVTGRLTCNGLPAKDVKIKLYEKEKIKDVKMDETRTDVNGEFKVSGYKTEITNIDPQVNIYHKCNYNGLCYKKVGIKIPSNFISIGILPKKTFDIGEINLANQFKGTTTDCIN
ncbi:hypothetical protein GCK72_017583 [Caenorhabditis remanei]|uniref:Uncharacterized protein n=1 Tax=Caenorhabditis remanei TaxID=31234 RepID=A0A6A5G8F5_CAERE|nr:hypothetical protein GCK72_017583 [Caenorhabditis remanei]KAF1751031.1 hypothetical protein GCK72_017583 [Caenorhabditis remanei]